MNKKFRFVTIVLCVILWVVSCAPPTEEPNSTSTEAPTEVTTEAPTGETEAPTGAATQAPTGETETPDVVRNRNVAILVADIFHIPVAEDSGDSNFCYVTPDGLGKYGGGGLSGQSLTVLGEPHGVLVYNQVIQSALEGGFHVPATGGTILPPYTEADFSGVDGRYTWIKRLDHFELEVGGEIFNLIVVAVDSEGLNLGALGQYIPTTISLLNSPVVEFEGISLPRFDNFVVNMSFGMVPCRHIDEESYNFESYLEEVGDPDVLQRLVALRANLQSRDDWSDEVGHEAYLTITTYPAPPSGGWKDDVFYEGIETTLKDNHPELTYHAVYVAAAGNQGFTFPLAPAYWDFVISVSAEGEFLNPDVCRNNLWILSNCGEVKMDGKYLDDPLVDETPFDAVFGTSFAAPRFSLKVGYHMILQSICPEGLNNPSEDSATNPWINVEYACSP